MLAGAADEMDWAAEFYQTAVTTTPEKKALIGELWGMDLMRAERYADAAKVFRKVVNPKRAPEENALFYYYLAGALAMDGHYDESLKSARRAAAAPPCSTHPQSRPAAHSQTPPASC